MVINWRFTLLQLFIYKQKVELTNELYTKLFKRALAYTNLDVNRRDEDLASEAVLHLLERQKITSATTELQFWSFANITLKNYCITQIRKKQDQVQYLDEITSDLSASEENDTMLQQVKEKLSEEEYAFAVSYFRVDRNTRHKTNAEKVKMAQIKAKVLAPTKQKEKYQLIRLSDNSIAIFNHYKEIGELLQLSAETVRQACKKGSKLKKEYFVKKIYI